MSQKKLPDCLDADGKIQQSLVPIVSQIRDWLEETRKLDSIDAHEFAESVGESLLTGRPEMTVELITNAANDYFNGIPSTYAHPNCMAGRELEIFNMALELAKAKAK